MRLRPKLSHYTPRPRATFYAAALGWVAAVAFSASPRLTWLAMLAVSVAAPASLLWLTQLGVVALDGFRRHSARPDEPLRRDRRSAVKACGRAALLVTTASALPGVAFAAGAPTVTYIGKNSMDAWDWVNDSPSTAQTSTQNLTPVSGFFPSRVTTASQASGGIYPADPSSFTQSLVAGQTLTIKIRVAPGTKPGGVCLNYRTGGAGTAAKQGAYIQTLTTGSWVVVDPNTKLVRTTPQSDGSYEAVFTYVVQTTDVGKLQIGVSTATNTAGNQVDVWGLQAVVGASDAPWIPTASTTIVTGTEQFVIDPHDFGAVGDAVSNGDGVIAVSGTASMLTTASYVFSATDVGKSIWVDQTPRKITSVSNGSAIFTPGGAATGSNRPWLVGTDDTKAIRAAIAYAASFNGGVGGVTSPGQLSGGLPQGADVQLRSGHAYLVSNSAAAYASGQGVQGCVVLPRRIGFKGSGAGSYTSAIYVAPNSYGHVICNAGLSASMTSAPYVDYLTISNLIIFGNSYWNPNQLDGVHIDVSYGNFQRTDANHRLLHLTVYDVWRNGLYCSGRGEWFVSDISVSGCYNYGIYLNGLEDSTFVRCDAGGNSLTGIRVWHASNCKFVSCKAYYNGLSGQTDDSNCANWVVDSDQERTGLTIFSACDGQQSRGSSWVIGSGLNVFEGCRAQDPGDPALNQGKTALPAVLAGFYLKGANARQNTFASCRVEPSVYIFSTPNWTGTNAVQLDGTIGTGSGPQLNAGDIFTFQPTTNTDGTTQPGITYAAGYGPVGGGGSSNGKNTGLRVNGKPCT